MSTLAVDVPRKLAPLLQPARYKGAHGGRGGAKSHFFAEQLVLRCFQRKTRAVCIREVQESIKDSVKALIEAKIQKLGLGAVFDPREGEIRCPHGGIIIFRGMQSYNAENIKSLEDFDIAWVEEAQTLSDISLRMLRPTLRKEGSEIWCSWNPRHDTDAVDKFLRANKPDDAIVVEVNWNDNPWFPDVLRREKDADYAADPEMAEHVWGGGYEIVSEGAYYAKLLAHAEREGRIGHWPHDPTRPVYTSWDLGVDDYTAIWFVQQDGVRATVIDYHEFSDAGAPEIVAQALPELFKAPPLDEQFIAWNGEQALQALGRSAPWRYAEHYLPHDVRMREWGGGARSRVETLRALGLTTIRKGAAQGPEERINAARRILPVTRFHATPRVQAGLKRLRRYRRKWNDSLNSYTTPLHDEASHGADAFGEFAINCALTLPKPAASVAPTHQVYVADEAGNLKTNMSVWDAVMAKKRRRENDE